MDFKDRIRQNVEKYAKREDPARVKRKNSAPEKLTETAVKEWATRNNISLLVFEAKATFSQARQSYNSRAVAPGFPDMAGNNQDGLAMFVELKALGKNSTIRLMQWDFLFEKINQNCFAACVDSATQLDMFYRTFDSLQTIEARKAYLMGCLPRKPSPKDDDGALFKD
jgi:hypothetical protein